MCTYNFFVSTSPAGKEIERDIVTKQQQQQLTYDKENPVRNVHTLTDACIFDSSRLSPHTTRGVPEKGPLPSCAPTAHTLSPRSCNEFAIREEGGSKVLPSILQLHRASAAAPQRTLHLLYTCTKMVHCTILKSLLLSSDLTTPQLQVVRLKTGFKVKLGGRYLCPGSSIHHLTIAILIPMAVRLQNFGLLSNFSSFIVANLQQP